MVKKPICLSVAVFAALSLISCGRTVPLATDDPLEIPVHSGYQAGTEIPAEENSTAENTRAVPDKETTTEPDGNHAPTPVKINTDMPEDYELPESCEISGFEPVLQNPELPTGCEITALAQTLNFYGFPIDKTELCDLFLPIDINGYYSMNDVYLGDPVSQNGFGCNAPVIKKAADDYFASLGSDWYATDISGYSLREVFYQIDQGRPVIVWSTIDQRETYAEFQFTLGCGEDFYFNPFQHCLTIYGYDYSDGTVHVADPLVGNVKYEMQRFERIYDVMNDQAVILCGNPESAGVDYLSADEKKKWFKEYEIIKPEDINVNSDT